MEIVLQHYFPIVFDIPSYTLRSLRFKWHPHYQRPPESHNRCIQVLKNLSDTNQQRVHLSTTGNRTESWTNPATRPGRSWMVFGRSLIVQGDRTTNSAMSCDQSCYHCCYNSQTSQESRKIKCRCTPQGLIVST